MSVPDPGELLAVLRDKFGHDEFRDGQLEVLKATFSGRDVVAVMPTGGGKSLLYQLPGVMLPGLTLVVSPLIALMKDQVDQLQERDLPATFINSSLPPSEQVDRFNAAAAGDVKLLYIAPERFRNERFRRALSRLEVSLLAIDEAHCISEWGHDFRPDYRRLGEARALVGGPPIIALTATATPEVRNDIRRELELDDPLTLVTGFERKNLILSVVQARGNDHKLAEIESTMAEAGAEADAGATPGIVYVSSRKTAGRVAAWLEDRGHRVGVYHAGLDDAARNAVQNRFMSGDLPVIVATNAFGMGIDKADIRFVVHHDFPKSLEAYYQEIGRAGRDGAPAHAKLLFSFADKRIQEFFIEGANPSVDLVRKTYTELTRRVAAARRAGADDDRDPPTAVELATSLKSKNDFAVASAVALLERAGVVRRTTQPGSRRRPIRVLRHMRPEELPIDGAQLRRKLEADQRMLDAVIKFAYNRGCRKEQLLAYFGDDRRTRTCGACDLCLGKTAGEARELDQNETATALACLKTVRSLDGRLGLSRLGNVLVGQSDDVVERLRLAPVGAGELRHLGKRPVLDWLDALLDARYLEKETIGQKGAYVVRLGRAGKSALDGVPLLMSPPEMPESRPKRAPAAGKAGKAARGTKAGKRADAKASDLGAAAPADPALLGVLKSWRTDESQRRKVPAYIVASNKVLEAVASARPQTQAELAKIPGIGPQKLETYGEAILGLTRQGSSR